MIKQKEFVKDLLITPNQSLRQAMISFELQTDCFCTLKIFAKEHEVRVLLNEFLCNGTNQVLFAYGSLKSTEYLVKLILNTTNSLEIETIKINI